MADQLDLVKNLPLIPDFIINLKIPDKDLEKRRCEQRVDPLTDTCTQREEEEREEITPELVARLVTRPEDLPQNVASSIKKYRDMMLRTLEDYMADHDQQRLIELDGNENPKVVFKSLMMKLTLSN
ncbi:Adenylate kinase [Desmophyllum pertusum]|uniref:Adenylate kinase n=1 Tax=Desmophyllum pertusum TaxID=174260 RepID=A0A9X0CLZ4_9CNID|nr:Adenylate kinase [Desmophyllum pertusum]